MSNEIGANDPLGPVYKNDPGKLPPDKSIKGLTTRTNLAVLIAIGALILALYAVIGTSQDKSPAPAPAAVEVE